MRCDVEWLISTSLAINVLCVGLKTVMMYGPVPVRVNIDQAALSLAATLSSYECEPKYCLHKNCILVDRDRFGICANHMRSFPIRKKNSIILCLSALDCHGVDTKHARNHDNSQVRNTTLSLPKTLSLAISSLVLGVLLMLLRRNIRKCTK